jgi:hypothetical protein
MTAVRRRRAQRAPSFKRFLFQAATTFGHAATQERCPNDCDCAARAHALPPRAIAIQAYKFSCCETAKCLSSKIDYFVGQHSNRHSTFTVNRQAMTVNR